jgi:hypothetical protein
MNWLAFVFLTVLCWGVYGIFLHRGTLGMLDPVSGRYKAFLYVGLAYFVVAVLAPLAVLKFSGARLDWWNYPGQGVSWSFVAGAVGAVGALGVLIAFATGGRPAVVMSIVFAGAPVVNAIVAIALHPPEGGIATIKPAFWAGIALAALGGYLVKANEPAAPPAKHPVTQTENKPAAH